tara:strand:+ start:1268 stop:2905 length:1638 start_codon:yes stop_codon:yes gene_type:complete
MSDDVLITPASRKIEFKDSSGNVDGKIELNSSGDLNITAPGGGLNIGDTSADVYIGDGSANVDIIFEQNGEIRGVTGRTITLGQSDSNIAVNALNFTSGGNAVMTSATVFPSGTTTTGLPTAGALNLGNPPEVDNHVFHPFLHNDLGHFVERGGSYAWSGLYGGHDPSSTSTSTLFNASGDFCSINNVDVNGSTITLTLTNLPKNLSYSAYTGVVFGHDNFAPPSMLIETSTNGGSSWTTRLNDSSKKTVYTCTFDSGGTATNAIRYTFGKATASSQIRIQSIVAYDYNSRGMENYFLPLDGGTVYGDISLGNTDTTFSRSSAGVVTIEGNTILTTGTASSPTTTTSVNDADHVLINDGGVMKKITPANLGIGGGTPSQLVYNNTTVRLTAMAGGTDTSGNFIFNGNSGKDTVWDYWYGRFKFYDNVSAWWGTSGDFRITHNGSDTYMQELGTGNLYISGGIVFSNSFTVDGSILPDDDDTHDLGSSSKQWRDIYTGDINLNNTRSRDNEVDGTRGSWTIQEGADDLFLLNRLNGKKYKFKLEEM